MHIHVIKITGERFESGGSRLNISYITITVAVKPVDCYILGNVNSVYLLVFLISYIIY